MSLRRSARHLWLVATAWTGVVLGHAITYVLTVPQAAPRDALLASTGHSYWSAAVAAAIVLGLGSAAWDAARNFLRGLDGGRKAAGRDTLAGLALRLALLQSGIFVVQETLERLQAGSPLHGLVAQHILLVGIPLQILVALVGAALLVWLGRAAEAAGRILRSTPIPRPALAVARVYDDRAPHGRHVAGVVGIRAPPR
jgi:hypothetical protein